MGSIFGGQVDFCGSKFCKGRNLHRSRPNSAKSIYNLKSFGSSRPLEFARVCSSLLEFARVCSSLLEALLGGILEVVFGVCASECINSVLFGVLKRFERADKLEMALWLAGRGTEI